MKLPKLVFYSGGQDPRNADLHRAVVDLAQLTKPRTRLTMTYIPFCTDGAEAFFKRSAKRYASFGVAEAVRLDPEQKPSLREIREALRSDIVYLAGGNTFYFLQQLKRAGMIPLLRSYVRRGGVLAGLSAGALIMTPNIDIAAAPGLDPDPNEVDLKNFSGLGLVPFEFSPHFYPGQRWIAHHLAYSRRTPRVIYACEDGGGIIVQGRAITFIGRTWAFYRGSMLRVK